MPPWPELDLQQYLVLHELPLKQYVAVLHERHLQKSAAASHELDQCKCEDMALGSLGPLEGLYILQHRHLHA